MFKEIKIFAVVYLRLFFMLSRVREEDVVRQGDQVLMVYLDRSVKQEIKAIQEYKESKGNRY